MNERILIVTRRGEIAHDLNDKLRWGQYRAAWTNNARDAASAEYELLIIDISIGKDETLELIGLVRSKSDAVILVLHDDATSDIQTATLQAGADGRIPPSIPVDELLARIAAHVRRPALVRGGTLSIGDLGIDFGARQCTVQGDVAALTRVEFDLLAALILHRGSTVTRSWLANNVLHDPLRSAERNLDAHMSHLRTKLGAASHLIQTVRGVGYRVEGVANES